MEENADVICLAKKIPWMKGMENGNAFEVKFSSKSFLQLEALLVIRLGASQNMFLFTTAANSVRAFLYSSHALLNKK